MSIEILNTQKEDAKQLADVFNLSFHNDYVKYGECPGFNKTEEDILIGMKKNAVF